MKRMFLMTVMAMMMAACNNETPEMPDNSQGDEKPGNQTEQPDSPKKAPSMGEVINLHKAIADAVGNKPSTEKVNLANYVKDYSYVKDTYKNNKYIIEFADGQVSVLDLNPYESKTENRTTRASRQVKDSRSGEANDSTFSNSRILLWEPAPFGSVVNDNAKKLLTDYVGVDNVVSLSGGDCTWQSLMQLSEYAVVLINGLGVDGQWVVTGQEFIEALDYSSIKQYISIYTAIVDGVLKNYYMVNDKFIAECLAGMNERGVVFNAAASGAEKDGLADAFAKIGYPTYVGLDNMSEKEWTTEKVETFMTTLFAGHSSTGEAFKAIEGDYEYPDVLGNTVKVGFRFIGDENLYCPYTAFTDKMAVMKMLDLYGVADKYDFEGLLAANKIVLDYNGRINMLDLSEKGLTGSICKELMWLDQLYMLNLGENALSGEIPAFLGNYPHLTSLMLDDNQLTGNVPTSFQGYYDKGGFVNLSGNKLEGQIPFGKYTDNNMFFKFDRKYQYMDDGGVIENESGLWYSDEPIQ